MEIKVVGNKNPSGNGQGGVVYDAEGITGALNVAHSTALNVAIIDAIYNSREPRVSDTCPTLRSERTGLLVKGGVRIRRLTPREVWRLQGFPDEYFDKAKAAGLSDSQLYKTAGNAVSVPVAKAIGLRLKEIENE